MQLLSTTPSVTMSSFEMVEFINLQEGRASLTHANFMAKVPKVLGEGGLIHFRDTYKHPQNGQTYPCYRFPKREACLMAMSYSYDLQAKVFDRMTELEAKQAPAMTELSRMDILKIAMAAEEENQQLRLEVATQAHRLDESSKWASIKRMEAAYGLKFKFSELRRYSLSNGYKMPKVPDANYPAGVNTYHEDVWMEVYGVEIKLQPGVI